MHTIASLKDDLRRMGLCGNETLLVHSSMKSIGQVEGGADGVLDAFSQFFAEGMLVFPTLTYLAVDGREGKRHFDVRTTSSCTGILPELFWHRPNVFRSLHPTHSLTALGRDAENLIVGHECFDTAFNAAGPFGRLLQRGAKVLLVGVTLTSATFIHAIEEWANVPILSREPIHVFSTNADGVCLPVDVHWHTGAHSEVFDRACEVLTKGGALSAVRFGDVPSLLMDCRRATEILIPILTENPAFFRNPDALDYQ